jgi:CRP-like cAMP-binding protein
MTPAFRSTDGSPALTRLSALAPLGPVSLAALDEAQRQRRQIAAHREVTLAAGNRLGLILSGWAARVRHWSDGRRQIMQVLLAGDLLDIERAPDSASIIALTPVEICPTPQATSGSDGLTAAFEQSRALERYYMFRHIARLGRLNAVDRLTDWLLETHDRLALAGLANGNRFDLPITQETLADLLGLTSVHVNRTLQLLRRDQVLEWNGGALRLIDPEALARHLDYQPARAGPRQKVSGF